MSTTSGRTFINANEWASVAIPFFKIGAPKNYRRKKKTQARV
jgi:hypothetical protein